MPMPEARRHFAALMERPQGDYRLAEAALYLAQEEYLQMSAPAYLSRIDDMAQTIKGELGLELDPVRIVQEINTHLFDNLGFQGNRDQYYDPRNSFLNEVIDRALGIPITLSVIYIEVGRLVGLPIAGVSMRGAFHRAVHGAARAVLDRPVRARRHDDARGVRRALSRILRRSLGVARRLPGPD